MAKIINPIIAVIVVCEAAPIKPKRGMVNEQIKALTKIMPAVIVSVNLALPAPQPDQYRFSGT